ncbi:MAG TPA: pyridoxamine 5'-phosphate oxidase family protein [Cyclobacteriaceae bacterium]|nr:pyridoxamine 5'-phosphate oxidase family protein [Cyclobacteriaceae bacterium]
MIGDLTQEQIDQVLHMSLVGRLGLINKDQPYVVPVSYAFDGEFVYCHSREGFKITSMRKNQKICFQVDIIDNLNSWRSVLVVGKYEEIKTENERKAAVQLLGARLNPILFSNIVNQHARNVDPPRVVEKKQHAVYYRIRIAEKTGRFQKPYA